MPLLGSFSRGQQTGAWRGMTYFLGNAAEQQTCKPTKPASSDDDQVDLMRLAEFQDPGCRIAVLNDSLDLGGTLLSSQVLRFVDDSVGDVAQHIRLRQADMLDVLQFLHLWRNPMAAEITHNVKEDDFGSVLGRDLSAVSNSAF